MRTQVAKWGNSLAVRLPRQITESAGITEGTTLDLEVGERGELRLTRTKPSYTLEELLAQITPDTLPDEVFDDGPKGREAL